MQKVSIGLHEYVYTELFFSSKRGNVDIENDKKFTNTQLHSDASDISRLRLSPVISAFMTTVIMGFSILVIDDDN